MKIKNHFCLPKKITDFNSFFLPLFFLLSLKINEFLGLCFCWCWEAKLTSWSSSFLFLFQMCLRRYLSRINIKRFRNLWIYPYKFCLQKKEYWNIFCLFVLLIVSNNHAPSNCKRNDVCLIWKAAWVRIILLFSKIK